MKVKSELLAFVIAACLFGCGPTVKVSHLWGTTDSHCAPVIHLKVESDADVMPKSVSISGAVLKDEIPFSRIGNAWEGGFAWHPGADKSTALEIGLERNGKMYPVTYDPGPSPLAAELHLLPAAPHERGARFWADVVLQPDAQRSEFARSRTAARIVADEMKFSVRICRVAYAKPSEGHVELGVDSLVYRVPLTRVLGMRIRQGASDTVGLPLAIGASGARRGSLRIDISSRELVDALFADVASTPWNGAPPFRPGAPLLWKSKTSRLDLLRPAETTVAEVAAVADLLATDTTVQTCVYSRRGSGNPYLGNGFPEGTVTRTRHDMAVSVREVRSGRVIASRTFAGAAPAPCPRQVTFEHSGLARTNFSRDLAGSPPSSEAIQSWLKTL